ncbi:MAG: patatin-like phospholipase family protein [Acidobacteriota bacterium]
MRTSLPLACSPSPRRALVLSGGGSLGAYQVGVIKALALGLSRGNGREPFDPGLVVGTSVGAFNAAFLAAQGDVPFTVAARRLEALWLEHIADRGWGNGIFRNRLSPTGLLRRLARDPAGAGDMFLRDLLETGSELSQALLRSLRDNREFFAAFLSALDLSSFTSVEPLVETIQGSIDFRQLADSPRNLLATAAKWPEAVGRSFDGRSEIWTKDGVRILLAATALPGIFPPVPIDGAHYVDGSLTANAPVAQAINAGATELHLLLPFMDLLLTDRVHSTGTLNALYRVLMASWGLDCWTSLRDAHFMNQLDASDEGAAARTEFLAESLTHGLEVPQRGGTQIRVYLPEKPLGCDLWQLLDFRYPRISRLIECGFRDATRQRLFKSKVLEPLMREGRPSMPARLFTPPEPGGPLKAAGPPGSLAPTGVAAPFLGMGIRDGQRWSA